MARKMNYLKGVHIKQICDFGLTIALLFQRRCKDMKQLMCILRRDEPTQTTVMRWTSKLYTNLKLVDRSTAPPDIS